MKFILIALNVIMIIVTIYFYLNLRREIKMKNHIAKASFLRKICIFSILNTILVFLSVIVIIYNVFWGTYRIRKNNNIDNYESCISRYINNDNVHSILSSFPKNIDKDKAKSFGEYNRDGLFDGSYFIYLRYQYDEISFNNELGRIKILSNEMIEKDGSSYIIYVISNDYNGTSEYTLVDNDNYQVIYVFNQLFSSNELDVNKNFFLE